MKLAAARTLVDKMYATWRDAARAAENDRQDLEAAMSTFVVSQEWRDILAEDRFTSCGKARACKWALATVLHAVNQGAGVTGPVNWTYGESLADDYHLLVLRRQLVSRTQAALSNAA